MHRLRCKKKRKYRATRASQTVRGDTWTKVSPNPPTVPLRTILGTPAPLRQRSRRPGSQGRGLSQKSVAKQKHFAISSATHLALSLPGRTALVLVGYARVSTDDQNLTLQRTALKQAGCKRIYEEKVSGATRDRPALTRMLDQLREGDVVVVARLDRLPGADRPGSPTCGREHLGPGRREG